MLRRTARIGGPFATVVASTTTAPYPLSYGPLIPHKNGKQWGVDVLVVSIQLFVFVTNRAPHSLLYLKSMFGFGPSATIDVQFDGSDKRLKKQLKREGGEVDSFEIYQGHEAVSGVCRVIVAPGKKVEHIGIKIEMIGQIGKIHFPIRSRSQVQAFIYFCPQSSFMTVETTMNSHLWCGSLMHQGF